MYEIVHGEIDGIRLAVRKDTHDFNICQIVMEQDDYNILCLSKDVTSPLIVDIGTHIGCFSRLCAKVFPDGTIHTYEANPYNYELAQQNLATCSNVTMVNKAVVGNYGCDGTELMLDCNLQINTGGWGVWYKGDTLVETIEFEEVIDSALRVKDRIDLLKVDCEGSEFEIVLNSNKDLWKYIDRVYMEIHVPPDVPPGRNAREIFEVFKPYYKHIDNCGISGDALIEKVNGEGVLIFFTQKESAWI